MASPITSADFQLSSFGGDVCEVLRKLLEVNDKMREWFEWAFDSAGNPTNAFKVEFQDIAVAVGVVVFRPVQSVPTGYLACNGQAVSRTVYANLFAIFGTTFGTGDGSTTFNLPDFNGKFLRGSGPGGTNPVGSIGGETDHTLTIAEMPSHQHDGWPGALRWLGTGAATTTSGSQADAQGTHVTDIKTVAAGGGAAHNNLPPYFTGYWLVKY